MRGLLAVLVLLLAFPAGAHVTSTGLAVLQVDGALLSYSLTLVTTEQEGEMGRVLDAAAEGNAAAVEQAAATLREAARFSIDGAGCVPGRITVQGSRAADGKVVLAMALSCPKPDGSLVIRDDWSKVLGGHFQTIMTVRVPDKPSVELAFGEDRREAVVELASTSGTGWIGFITMGAEHILGGLDHLLFLLALLALAKGVWPIVRIVTGFTIAHSITLSLAALDMVHVPARIVEPLIAATIVWVALENLLAPAQTRWRWLVAAAFGLIHGLGFASALTELGLPRDAMVRALIGFNLGVELGQLAFVAVVMPAIIWLARPSRLPRLPQLLSILVAVMGAVWFVERIVPPWSL